MFNPQYVPPGYSKEEVEKLLIKAIQEDNLNLIKFYVEPHKTTGIQYLNLHFWRDARGYSALHLAIEAYKPPKQQVIKYLLANYKNLINQPTNDKLAWKPIQFAAVVGCTDALLLLKAASGYLASPATNDASLFLLAADNGQLETLVKLMQRGNPLGIVNKEGDTALQYAKEKKHIHIVDFLQLLLNIPTAEAPEKEIQAYLKKYFEKLNNRKEKRLALSVTACILAVRRGMEGTSILYYLAENVPNYLFSLYKWCQTFKDETHNTLLHLLINEDAIAGVEEFIEVISKSRKLEQMEALVDELSKVSLNQGKSNKEEVYLFLGGGDLSFELSFAKKHPALARHMVVTTYENELQLRGRDYYQKYLRNGNELVKLTAKVYHGVDAGKLHEWDFLAGKHVSRIYFCHPWAGEGIGGHDTKLVLRALFQSASRIQEAGGRILIPRRRNNGDPDSPQSNNYYKGMYGFHHLRRREGNNLTYRLVNKHTFTTDRYAGYSHVTTGKSATSPFKNGGSLEYVFEKVDAFIDYDSNAEEDSDSDTEVSQMEPHAYLENRNKDGQSLLHLAVKAKRVHLVEVLLQLGASPEAIDSSGKPPLFYVWEVNEPSAVSIAKELINFGAKLDYLSSVASLGTPFENALRLACQKNTPFLRTLIKLFIQSDSNMVKRYSIQSKQYSAFLFDICTEVVKELKAQLNLSGPTSIRLIRKEIDCFMPAIEEGGEVAITKGTDGKFIVVYKKGKKLERTIINGELSGILLSLNFDDSILNRETHPKVYELVRSLLKDKPALSGPPEGALTNTVLNVSGLGNNCGLFALTLGSKIALSSHPKHGNRLPEFIKTFSNEDLQKRTKNTQHAGELLRKEMAEALLEDNKFKENNYHSFIELVSSYLQGQKLDTDRDRESFENPNKVFMDQLKKDWEDTYIPLSKFKEDLQGKFLTSFNGPVDEKLISESIETVREILKKSSKESVEKLAREFLEELLKKSADIVSFRKIYQLIWARFTSKDASKETRESFKATFDKFFEEQMINYLNSQKESEKLAELYKLALLINVSFKENGDVSSEPLKDVVDGGAAYIFSLLKVGNKEWQEVYNNYCCYVRDKDVFLSADELGCLASRWDVQLKIQFPQGTKPYTSYDVQSNEKLHVTLCNPSRIHWNVQCERQLDQTTGKMNETEERALELIRKIKNVEWKERVMEAISHSKAYSRRLEDCSYTVGVLSAIKDVPEMLAKQGRPLGQDDNQLIEELHSLFNKDGVLLNPDDIYKLSQRLKEIEEPQESHINSPKIVKKEEPTPAASSTPVMLTQYKNSLNPVAKESNQTDILKQSDDAQASPESSTLIGITDKKLKQEEANLSKEKITQNASSQKVPLKYTEGERVLRLGQAKEFSQPLASSPQETGSHASESLSESSLLLLQQQSQAVVPSLLPIDKSEVVFTEEQGPKVARPLNFSQ